VLQEYVDILTPGAGYIAQSGSVYPEFPPSLDIHSLAGSLVLTWPGWASIYELQQNSVPGPVGWIICTNAVSMVNGTNQVTIAPATGASFYRLRHP
jgi:hypothetical protein